MIPKKPNKPSLVLIVAAVLGVLLVAGIIAVLVGVMTITFKSPSQKVIVSASVCDAGFVTRFNDAMTGYYSDDSTTDGSVAVQAVIEDFSKNKNYKQDPTCLFMKYRHAIVTSDYAVAKEMLEQLEQLAGKGLFVDGRVGGLVGFDSMSQSVQLIAPKEEIEFDD